MILDRPMGGGLQDPSIRLANAVRILEHDRVSPELIDAYLRTCVDLERDPVRSAVHFVDRRRAIRGERPRIPMIDDLGELTPREEPA